MHMLTKKRALVALATVGVMAVAGVAFAYFTSTGKGTGEATVGKTTEIVVTSATTGSLYPLTSKPAANTTIEVENKGTGVEFVKEVEETEITTSEEAKCLKAWFAFEGSSGKKVTVEKEVQPSEKLVVATKATLWLKDEATTNQSPCESATVTVHYTSN